MTKKSTIPGIVVSLGIVSFLTDVSSEMIYPLLPLFLATELGAGALALGVIEGVAESISAFLKTASGFWTDRLHRRKPFLIAGYGLAGLVRPLIGLAAVWQQVLGLRFLDRVGKGLRSAPRDAMIADATEPEQRGTAFGFHRAMDHAGAVVGPLLAAALMSMMGLPLRAVFLVSAIPAVLVLFILWVGVNENLQVESSAGHRKTVNESWKTLGNRFRWLMAAIFIFTLGNSTDAFLLLRMRDVGIPAEWIAVLWSLHHIVKMISTYVGGRFSDRLNRKRLLATGWLYYAAIYLLFATAPDAPILIATFLAYGIYYGLTEPVEKALISDMAPRDVRGAAFGVYHGCIGFAALPASLIFGLIWTHWSIFAAFTTGAGLALIASLIILFIPASASGTALEPNQP